MRKRLALLTLAAISALVPAVSNGQVTSPAGNRAVQQQHLIGEVTATDQTTGQITVKTDAGASVVVTANERTIYRRLPPGQTSIEKAEAITRADVKVGDRVLVPGGASGGQAARQVIVMAREAIAARREQEREDWRSRGANGRVVAVDTAQRQLTIETRSREGTETLSVLVPSNVRFRRYAPGSLRPADAVQGSFADIRVGDQARILGNRDGARLTAEEVISGRIARLNGVVEAVDASRREVTVKDNRTGQTVTVALGANAMLRRISPEFAERLRQRGENRRAGGASSTEGQSGERRRQRRERDAQDGQRGERQRAGGRGPQGMLENLPAITVADLKKGDAVIVTGTSETDDSHVTAATLITGEAEILQRMQRFQRGEGRPGNMSPGLPGGVVGGGTGDSEP
jgi:co-chaperonin GroES (HSP10)